MKLELDETWFGRARGGLVVSALEAPPVVSAADPAARAGARAREARAARHRRTGHAVRQGSAAAPDREVAERALQFLSPRHALASRGHMQLLRAALESSLLAPTDALVRAIVEVEWYWFATPFKPFYRDHLAHLLKVTATAQALLDDGLLAHAANELAAGRFGTAAIRGCARRLGVPPDDLADPGFWAPVVAETTRVACLLHDLAYPAQMAEKLAHAVGRAWADAARRLEGHLVATPFAEDPYTLQLDSHGRDLLLRTLRGSHSLQAGARILEFGEIADAHARLTPCEAFVVEWAALAASLHDYDRFWEQLDGRSPPAWLQAHREAFRPSFRRDPVSFVVALADQLQDFGRTFYRRESKLPDRAVLSARRPVRAVAVDLAVLGGPLRLTWRYAADAEQADIVEDLSYKRGAIARNFVGGRLDPWLDGRDAWSSVHWRVEIPCRQPLPDPTNPGVVERVRIVAEGGVPEVSVDGLAFPVRRKEPFSVRVVESAPGDAQIEIAAAGQAKLLRFYGDKDDAEAIATDIRRALTAAVAATA